MSGRGRYAKGVEKRAEILRTALDVFAREGYRGTTLREVAERCELSVAGVMHYFDSREDLLTQVILARDDDTALEPASPDDSRAPAASPADLGPDDGWHELLATVRRNAERPGLVELFVTLTAAARDTSHPAHDALAARYDRLRAAAVPLLRARRDAGLLPSGADPDALADLVIAVADGAQLQWLVDPARDLSAPLETLAGLLGLEPEPPTRSRPTPGQD
ncbi:TetR/AcrR family transcriptional regulator [Isoptericola cucumis]|nr:TetR/AcrR family transcriptional regulator [Isoptericola cucumis]